MSQKVQYIHLVVPYVTRTKIEGNPLAGQDTLRIIFNLFINRPELVGLYFRKSRNSRNNP